MIRKHFRLKRIVLGLAFAAFAAPAAQAYVIEGSGVQPQVVQRPIMSENSARPLTPLQVDGLRLTAMADAYKSQGFIRSENSFGPPTRSAAGAAIANARHTALPVVTTASASSTSDGFNWNDAGVGASVAFGITLLLLTAVALGRRYRSRLDPPGLASA